MGWKEYDLRIPGYHGRVGDDDGIIVIGIGFKYIVFVYNYYDEKVYCIDTLFKEIFVSHKTLPRVMGSSRSCVQTKRNNVYFINHSEPKHYMINLMDLIPNTLITTYKDNICNPLVFGYISRMNKKKILSNSIPVDVVNLILLFVPPFL